MDDKNEARADGGRRFQRPATEKDLDLAVVVLVRGTKSSCLSRERRGRRDEAIVNPGADKRVDTGGENRNRYSFANGSQTPQLEVGGAS